MSDGLTDEQERYLMQWYDSEGFSDFNLACDRGYWRYAAWLLDSAGVFQDTSPATVHSILLELASYTHSQRRRDVSRLLRNTEIWIHAGTNEYLFIPYGDLDYFVPPAEFSRDGYAFSHGYGSTGRRYAKATRLK